MLSSGHRANSYCERWSKQEMAFDAALESLPAAVHDSQPRVWAASDFVMQSCVRTPGLLADLIDSGDMLTQYRDPAAAYVQRVPTDLAEAADATALAQRLRSVRRREMLRIAWRDLAGWAELDENLHDLSALAESCVDSAQLRVNVWTRVEL